MKEKANGEAVDQEGTLQAGQSRGAPPRSVGSNWVKNTRRQDGCGRAERQSSGTPDGEPSQNSRSAPQPMNECPGCRAMRAEVEYLRQHVRDLTDRMVALASPTALAVARGEVAQPVPQVGLPMDDKAPVVLENGEITTAGDIRRVQAKVDEMMSGRTP